MGIIPEELDKKLMNLLQSGLPLTREPYADIARQFGVSEQEILERVSRLKDEGLIRIIGPVFNSRALGYESTLVTMKVPGKDIEKAAGIISRHPGVGHNYQRDHHFNLWFTMTLPGSNSLDEEIRALERQTRPEAVFQLPAVRLFKIQLYFDLVGNGNGRVPNGQSRLPQRNTPASLTPLEKKVINEVQQPLPVTSCPFDAMAANIGVDPDRFVVCLRSLMEWGIMRRFGASIEQQMAGFVSNVMVCWNVPGVQTEEIGMKMAAFKEVTHCYERETNPHWLYNVFTMLHSKTKEQHDKTVADIAAATGITEYTALATTRCFKKQRVRYRV